MIILIASQKGGAGKTTIATNLAAKIATNYDVLLLDADRQPSATEWCVERKANYPDSPRVHCVQRYDDIEDTLEDLKGRYAYIVVDSPGRDSIEMRSAMLVADIVIIPARPSQTDLNTIPAVSRIINQSKKINPSVKIFGLLTMASTNSQVKEAKEAAEFFSDFPSIPLLDVVISDRKIYRDNMSEGLSVVETGHLSGSAAKAKEEIESLYKEIFGGN